MNKKQSTFLNLIIVIFLILVFIKSKEINKVIITTSIIFIKNVFPSLFIMFIISDLLINLKLPELLGNLLMPVCNKLKIKKNIIFIFIFSLISGFPSSAKIINDLLEQNKLTIKEANNILKYTFFSNPLFIINTIGILLLKSKISGYIIQISHILGNIIIFFIYKNKDIIINKKEQIKEPEKNISIILFNSISKSIKTILSIFGIIIFFSCFTSILTNIINLNILEKSILTGIIEITNGINLLSIPNIDIKLKSSIITFLISFGGFSIHSQIMNLLENKNIKYLEFFKSRILHASISFIITYILCSIIP